MKIPYGKQSIIEEDIQCVVDVLRSDFLTTGPTIKQFEDEVARYIKSKYAVAVSSGTAALHLAVAASNLEKQAEVITSPMTFVASANSILYNSGKPAFADITERGLIDPIEIRENITEKTAGIIPVDYMGLPCEKNEISKIAKENDLFVIEDSCHALGARYKENPVGSCKYSDMTVFSFHPVKHITTGEGGMITTNDKNIYEKLKILRTHGITKDSQKFKIAREGKWYHEMQYLGFNYRMTDIQAALGLCQFKRLKSFITKRREIARRYFDFFEGLTDDIETIKENKNEYNSYHLFVIKLKDWKQRLSFYNFLREKEIFCQIHYIPVYWHPYYRDLGYEEGLCEKAEHFYNRIISLPMYPTLQEKELEFCEYVIKQFFNK